MFLVSNSVLQLLISVLLAGYEATEYTTLSAQRTVASASVRERPHTDEASHIALHQISVDDGCAFGGRVDSAVRDTVSALVLLRRFTARFSMWCTGVRPPAAPGSRFCFRLLWGRKQALELTEGIWSNVGARTASASCR